MRTQASMALVLLSQAWPMAIGGGLSACRGMGRPVQTMTAAEKVDPLFASVFAEAGAHTHVPVLLPRAMPDVGQGELALQAWVKNADMNRYTIIVSFRGSPGTPCAAEMGLQAAESQVCRFATLSGEVGASPACNADRRVVLARHLSGCLFDAPVGAGAGDAQIIWPVQGARYRIAIKGGSEEDAIALANAVIAGRNHP